MALPTEENADIADFEAKLLDINDCDFMFAGKDDLVLKKLEYSYFQNISLYQTKLFGGTLGKQQGGCTEFALSPNG